MYLLHSFSLVSPQIDLCSAYTQFPSTIRLRWDCSHPTTQPPTHPPQSSTYPPPVHSSQLWFQVIHLPASFSRPFPANYLHQATQLGNQRTGLFPVYPLLLPTLSVFLSPLMDEWRRFEPYRTSKSLGKHRLSKELTLVKSLACSLTDDVWG